MKANELRVGNLVFFRGREIVVHAKLLVSIEEKEYEDDYIQPIPLTLEILTKCGFEKDDDAGNWNSPKHDIYRVGSFKVGIKEDFIGWYNQVDDDFYSYFVQVKHLHQLQNLVYALTGEELNIQL
jgi:hypothetical protein